MQNTLSEHVTRLNTAKYYVTHHITYGDVKGNIYASEGEAFARFAELDGGRKAAAVWDESLRELKYYGARGQRPAEMMDGKDPRLSARHTIGLSELLPLSSCVSTSGE